MKEPRRFWSKVDVGEVNECWEWLAGKGSDGYGKVWQAHRVAWVLTYGPIPEGLHCCHHCDNPGCCNPYHLFLGTDKGNLLDAVVKGRTTRGEAHGCSKLTKEEVLDIRDLYATGEWAQYELADEFGVHQTAISQVVRRKRWKQI